MNKKQYIETIENLIVNRVCFHSPKAKSEDVDYSILKALNIEVSYPIFVFDKPLTKTFVRAFINAQKRCMFNLILFENPRISYKKLLKLGNVFIFDKNEIGRRLYDTLANLNINYVSTTEFNIKRKSEYLEVNRERIQLDYVPYYNYKKLMFNGIIGEIKQFLLNGKNYCFEFINTRDTANELEFELNLPLPRGYYFFKKTFDCIEINNLTTRETLYFNYFSKDIKVNFSCIDGIENCSCACVNVKGNINFKPKQKKIISFNFGDEKFSLFSPKEILKFFSNSQKQMFEIFDTQIISKNAKFDSQFNNEWPKSIWKSWLDFSHDYISEEKWLGAKGKIIKQSEYGIEISKDVNLKQIKMFKNGVWKQIFVMFGENNYLFAGKVKYYNFTILTKEIFDKNNEIYLSFVQ